MLSLPVGMTNEMKSPAHSMASRLAALCVVGLGLLGQPLLVQAAPADPAPRKQCCCCCKGKGNCGSACEGCSTDSGSVPSPEKAPAPGPTFRDLRPQAAVLSLATAGGCEVASLLAWHTASPLPRGRPPSSLLLNATFRC